MTRSEPDSATPGPAPETGTEGGEEDAGTIAEASTPTPEPEAGAAPTPRPGGRGVAVFALLLALVATAGAGYLFYQTEVVYKLQRSDQMAGVNRQVDAINARLSAFEAQFGDLKQRQRDMAQNLDQKISSRLEQIGNQQQALTESLEKVYGQLNRNLDSWALEEVEQLLRLANQSLILDRDVPSALAALELADGRLRDIGDPNLLPVRRQIANDMALLKAVPEIDISGLALRLGSMRSTVAKLPLVSEPQRELSAGDKSSKPAAQGWLASSRELLSDTIGLIRIQNISEPVRPLLTPEQRYFLLANLQLMLSSAQLAALQADPPTYRDNLGQAQQWLKQYFDTSDARVQKAVNDLQAMAKLDLAPPLPDISGSITALETAKPKTMTPPE